LRSRSYLFLLLVLGLAGLSVGLLNVRKVNYGLDVKGGIRIIYDMDQKDLQASGKKPADVGDKILRTLERRVSSSLGVVEGSVARKGETQFVIELPGYTNEKDAEAILGRSASLKFYHARTLVTELNRYRQYTDIPGQGDTTNPEVWFQRTGSSEIIKPGTPEYKAVIDSWGKPIISGDELADARPEGVGDNAIPQLFFSPAGSAKMEKWTRDYMNQREKLAAVLDNVVLSAPAVERGAILKESCIITGKFTHEYVVNLVNLLQSGALPVNLNQIGVESVDPTIGNYALNQMITAGAIAFGVIALFMVRLLRVPRLHRGARARPLCPLHRHRAPAHRRDFFACRHRRFHPLGGHGGGRQYPRL
jgi:SecD/SecF fusion protein